MSKICANCRYFAEIAANVVPSSRGECRLYPEPSLPKERTYWCGQWTDRVVPEVNEAFRAQAAELARVQQSHDLWDKKHDGLKTRIRDLEAALRWVKSHGSKHGMPDEIFAILETVGKDE